VARAKGIYEDYRGFYDDILEEVVDRALEDMITEANPHKCSEADALAGSWQPNDSPARLINWAWQLQMADSANFQVWENTYIPRFLNSYQISPITRRSSV
jgi:hypothetical protein